MSLELKPTIQPRAQATRAKLVRAATKTLALHGFRTTSTQLVAKRAGCSQGSLFRHFPTKTHLLAACVETTLATFVVDFRADVDQRLTHSKASFDDRIVMAVDGLWTIFVRRDMQAVFEVYVAARTNAKLGAALEPILKRHRESILVEAARLFPEAHGAGFEVAVDAVVYAMQGVVLGLFANDARAKEANRDFFLRLARNELRVIQSEWQAQGAA